MKGAAKRRKERLGMRSAVAFKRRSSLDSADLGQPASPSQGEAFRSFFQDLKTEQPHSPPLTQAEQPDPAPNGA